MLLKADTQGMDRAAALLLDGGVIGYPTETVYGLGGMADHSTVIDRIRHLKARDERKPMLVLIPDIRFLETLVRPVPEAERLAGLFWPGSLTLIFQAGPDVAEGLAGPDNSLGIRISPDPVCKYLMEKLSAALISTSANPAGFPPALSAGEVDRYFGDRLDAVLDDGFRNRSAPSTVLDVRTLPFHILREGSVTAHSLKQAAGDLFE